jgi:WD40 repeat protein
LVKKNFKREKPDWLSTEPVVEAEWNACLQTLEGHRDGVNSVAFSQDGQRLTSGSDDTTIKVWDPTSGSCLQTLQGHNLSAHLIVFSQDGKKLASHSSDNTIKVWDLVSGSCLQTLKGHNVPVYSIAFSQDDQPLASGSDDNTIKVRHPASGSCLETINFGTPVTHISFDHTGRYLITDVGSIKIAAVTTESPIQPDDSGGYGYGLRQDKSWITCNGQNVLWLPPEYRPACSAVQGRMISIGCTAGRVFTIGFWRDV